MKKIITIGLLVSSLFASMNTNLPNGAKELAYQEAYDSIAGQYAYRAYIQKDGKTIKIAGAKTADTVLTNKTCITLEKYDKYHPITKPYFVTGFDNLSEKNTKDNRIIEHRIYCDRNTGKAKKVEMVLQVRNANGSAKKKNIVSFPWPL
jgi:hypothetical protein